MNSEIYEILRREKSRQFKTAELIASENFASESVRELCGSIFTNKYAEGYPGARYYNGCEHMDEIETLAQNLVQQLFRTAYSNVQLHSGANANTAVYQAFLKPGDSILGMDLAAGGHLSHGAAVNISGKIYNATAYGVNNSGWIDYNLIQDLAKLHRPKIIVAGASAYPQQIDWKKIKTIADSVNAYLVADIAHYSGLIAGGAYDSPVDYADVVTSTTHKTLRGPRGGMILWNNPDYTKKINSAVFPGTQGGPLMNMVAAKAQCFSEALNKTFPVYANSVVENAKTMCEVFCANNIEVQTGGTASHIVLLNLAGENISGRAAADLLEDEGITVNKNSVPGDCRSFRETSGIRLGTAAETTRGRNSTWFGNTAQRISDIIKSA